MENLAINPYKLIAKPQLREDDLKARVSEFSSWDMALDSRALRSYFLIDIPVEKLDIIHAKEIQWMKSGRLKHFMTISTMCRLIYPWSNGLLMNKNSIDQLCSWVVKFKPIRDNSDEMQHGVKFNHKWDWASRIQEAPKLNLSGGKVNIMEELV